MIINNLLSLSGTSKYQRKSYHGNRHAMVTYWCEMPHLLKGHRGSLALEMAEFNRHQPSSVGYMQTQLLIDVMSELLVSCVFKILEGRTQKSYVRKRKEKKERDTHTQTQFNHTWFSPILWHMYMTTGFPPLFFSPTSRQLFEPEFWSCRNRLIACH